MFGPIGGPLGLSLAPQIRQSRGLYKWLKPIASWYARVAGHRQLGLRYDDLVMEEREDVVKALNRLDEVAPKESYDRAYRIRRAVQQSVLHYPLPRKEWLKASEDVRYLKPILNEVLEEEKERAQWDTMIVKRKK